MIKPLYVPILRAKLGEFTALENLSITTKSKILPLLDIPRNTSKAKIRKTDSEHLESVVSSICDIWSGRPLMVDATSWSPSAVTDDGEHLMEYLQASLEDGGVHVFPVVGYDRWDNLTYQAALTGINIPEGRSFVLRLDNDAIEDSLDFEYFQERIDEMLLGIGCTASECIVLVDLGDLSHKAVMDMIERLPSAIGLLHGIGFNRLIVAGSSIPETINLAVKNSDSVGYLPRKEVLIWQALNADFPRLVFGDYGVRSPRSNEDIIAPDTNGKIRYTVDKKFFISRGYSLRTKDKGAQHYSLAAKIVASHHYLGPDFSWGDLRISQCANGEFKGNSTSWISIDTNHHLEMVVQEVAEFISKPEVVLHK